MCVPTPLTLTTLASLLLLLFVPNRYFISVFSFSVSLSLSLHRFSSAASAVCAVVLNATTIFAPIDRTSANARRELVYTSTIGTTRTL